MKLSMLNGSKTKMKFQKNLEDAKSNVVVATINWPLIQHLSPTTHSLFAKHPRIRLNVKSTFTHHLLLALNHLMTSKLSKEKMLISSLVSSKQFRTFPTKFESKKNVLVLTMEPSNCPKMVLKLDLNKIALFWNKTKLTLLLISRLLKRTTPVSMNWSPMAESPLANWLLLQNHQFSMQHSLVSLLTVWFKLMVVILQIWALASRTEQFSHVKSPMSQSPVFGSETTRKSMNLTISNLFPMELDVIWSLKVSLNKILENMNSGKKSKI